MEQEAFDTVPYVPLGQLRQPNLCHTALQGIVPASAVLLGPAQNLEATGQTQPPSTT